MKGKAAQSGAVAACDSEGRKQAPLFTAKVTAGVARHTVVLQTVQVDIDNRSKATTMQHYVRVEAQQAPHVGLRRIQHPSRVLSRMAAWRL